MGVSLTLSNRLDHLVLLKQVLADQAQEWGLSERSRAHLELVAEELFVNTVNYGYNPGQSGQIQITLDLQGSWLRLSIEDDARPFDPTQEFPLAEDLDLTHRPLGGLGLVLVRRLAQSLTYTRTADNRNRAVIYLPL